MKHKIIYSLGWWEAGRVYYGYGCENCGKFFPGEKEFAEDCASTEKCFPTPIEIPAARLAILDE